MTVTSQDLADYVGAVVDEYVTQCLAVAKQMVTDYVGDVTVPDEIVDRATLEVGSELFHRKNAPNGVAQFASLDGAPIRVARDPMVAARPILAPYMPGGFA